MTLFSDESGAGRGHGRLRGRIAAWTLGVTAALGFTALVLPAPYVIEIPGPVFDTLGTVTIEGEQVPMISVPGQTEYPTEGELNLLTVSTVGEPDAEPSWFRVLMAWVDPTQTVEPMSNVYPEDQTVEELDEQNQVQMQNSQQEAIAAALGELGYEYTSTVTVASVSSGFPAEGQLEVGDVLRTANGVDITDDSQLREIIAANGTDAEIAFGITRDGHNGTVKVTPTRQQGTVLIGIVPSVTYDFPVQVVIQLQNVGGPSGGMMFALGIIDKLTEGALNGGHNISGTGTIDAAGKVGAIGGIKQKLVAADRAGSDWFLAPEANCRQVVGNIPEGLNVVVVSTLGDAVEALNAISTGEGVDDLATCTAD